VLSDAGEQLELGHGKAEGGVGGARRPAHGPAQPGHDVGQIRADLLAADLIRAYSVRANAVRANAVRANAVWANAVWASLRR
jgi:hypothetical protein